MRIRQFWFIAATILGWFALGVFVYPSHTMGYTSAVAGILAVAAAFFVLYRRKLQRHWTLATMPLMLLISAALAASVIASATARHILIMVIAISIGIFVDALVSTVPKAAPGTALLESKRLAHILGHETLMVIFGAATGIAAIVPAIGVPIAVGIIMFSLMTFLAATAASFPIRTLKTEERWGFLIVVILGTGEIFGALLALPLHYFTVGAATAITYYTLAGIARAYLTGTLTRSVRVWYAVVTPLLLALVLGTARWI